MEKKFHSVPGKNNSMQFFEQKKDAKITCYIQSINVTIK